MRVFTFTPLAVEGQRADIDVESLDSYLWRFKSGGSVSEVSIARRMFVGSQSGPQLKCRGKWRLKLPFLRVNAPRSKSLLIVSCSSKSRIEQPVLNIHWSNAIAIEVWRGKEKLHEAGLTEHGRWQDSSTAWELKIAKETMTFVFRDAAQEHVLTLAHRTDNGDFCAVEADGEWAIGAPHDEAS